MNRLSILSETNIHNYRAISRESDYYTKIKAIWFKVKRGFVPPKTDELIGRAALFERPSVLSRDRESPELLQNLIMRALSCANRKIPFIRINDSTSINTLLSKMKPGEEAIFENKIGYAYLEKGQQHFNVKIIYSKPKLQEGKYVSFTAHYEQLSLEEASEIVQGGRKEEDEKIDPSQSQEKAIRTKVKMAWKLVKEIVNSQESPIKLKTILADLGTLYKEVHHKILTDPDSYLALNKLLRAAARELLEAYEKGKITAEERDALIPQLLIIQSELEKTTFENQDFPKIKSEQMRSLFLTTPKVGPKPLDIEIAADKPPKVEPPKNPVNLDHEITSVDELQEVLDGPFNVEKILSINTDMATGELVSRYALFFPVIPKYNEDFFLWDISVESAKELFEKINKHIVNYKNFSDLDNPDSILALAKLLALSSFIGSRYNLVGVHHGLSTVLFYFTPSIDYHSYDRPRETVFLSEKNIRALDGLRLYLSSYNARFGVELHNSVQGAIRSEVDGNFINELPKFLKERSGLFFKDQAAFKTSNILGRFKAMNNPLLNALFLKFSLETRNAPGNLEISTTDPATLKSTIKIIPAKEEDFRSYSMMSEEAIMHNPIGVAEFAINALNENLVREDLPTVKNLVKWEEDDIKALMIVTRSAYGQLLILDFIEKRPHLLDDPEILNYLSNLFFQTSLFDTLIDNNPFREELPAWIETQIEKYKDDIEKRLFFYEMHERLRVVYEQKNYTADFKDYDTSDWSKDKLNEIYTIELYKKLNRNSLNPDEAVIAVKQYRYLLSHPLESLKRDPIRDAFIKRRMEILFKDLNVEEKRAPVPSYILNDPRLSDLQGVSYNVKHEFVNGKNIYQFTSQNKWIQVEELAGEIHVYRKIKGFDGLIEQLNSDALRAKFHHDPNTELDKQLKQIATGKMFIFEKLGRILALARGDLNKYRSPQLFKILDHLYVNPDTPHLMHSFSEKGDLEFTFELRNGKIQSAQDKRDNSGPWTIVSGSQIDHPFIKQLGLIEDSSRLLIFAKNGKIERVEIPRLNLKLEVRGNNLYGTGPLAGYRLDLSERSMLPLSMRFVPDDETKPIKIIIPESKTIIQGSRLSTRSDIPFIAWIVDALSKIYDFLTAQYLMRFIEYDYVLDPKENIIKTHILNVNPITHEFNRGETKIPLAEAFKQAILVGDIKLAENCYRDLNLNEIDLTHVLIDLLQVIFIPSSTPEMHTFKLNVGTHLKSLMKKNERFEVFVKDIDRVLKPLEEAKEKKTARYKKFKDIKTSIDSLETPPPFIPKPTTFNIDKDTPLLFNPNQISLYFSVKEEERSAFTLPLVEEGALACERTAVDTTNENLKKFTPKKKTVELKNKEHLLSRLVEPKITLLEGEVEARLKSLYELIYRSEKGDEQLAILSGRKPLVTETELMLALLQNDLDSLIPLLPEGCDLHKLKSALIVYYDAIVKLHHAKVLKEAILDNADHQTLFEVLNRTRKYDPALHPELLLFEVMSFVTFRKLAVKDQLELLNDLTKNPSELLLAPTGSGKTMLLSIIRGLIKANGTNLVTQKVLPQLFNQTVQQMQLLSDVFRKRVYPFRYDPKLKPVVRINDENVSTFTLLYNDMLRIIRDKGILITDYKSLPLLEEKFFSLSYELMALHKAGHKIPAIELEHWTSLKQILNLLKNHEDQMMDEFDEPNRPIHRIQMAIKSQEGGAPAHFLLEETSKLYDRLMQEEELMLAQNLQEDIPEDIRNKIISKLAKEYAQGDGELESYYLGESEAILPRLETLSPEERDRAAFLKDQFTIFLPLCLNNSHNSRYKRSNDGARLLPCESGVAHDAKFGNIIEEINYTHQEYLQAGVHPNEIAGWIKNINHSQEAFEKVFEGLNVEASIESLVEIANTNSKIRDFFLKRKLNSLKVSGAVVSMNPHNANSMAKVVSGVSATMGDPDALSSSFTYRPEEVGSVQTEMIYRFMDRVQESTSIIEYDPANPLQMIDGSKEAAAIIDGAGAFKRVKPEKVGEHFKGAYHDENGNIQNSESDKFYFAQAYTRGFDRKFKPDAKAVQTVNGKGTLEQLNQQEGRMRLPGQKIRLARSKYNPEIKNAKDVIQKKVRFQAKKQAKDIYDSKKLEADNALRNAAKLELIKINDIKEFFNQFETVQHHFIAPASSTYQTPGSYFEKHKHIVKLDGDPIEELKKHRDNNIEAAKKLKLEQAIKDLQNIDYPESLRSKLLDKVATRAPETEIEVELEEELEMEQEQEAELELETRPRNKMEGAFYIPHSWDDHVIYPASDIHKAFNLKSSMMIREKFQPHAIAGRRKVFDEGMFRVGHVEVYAKLQMNAAYPNDFQVVVNDRLTSVGYTKPTVDKKLYSNRPSTFIYDIDRDTPIFLAGEKQFMGDVLKDPIFANVIAQVKFMDGRIDGYRDNEVEYLKVWLTNNNPQEMLDFLLNHILKYREGERDLFPASQLGKIFNQLIH